MTKSQRERLESLKSEVTYSKSGLLRLQDRVAEVSPRKADQLGRIIARLEAWQNS